MPDIRAIYAQTGLWHGTGRYKYDEDGKIVDTLQGLIAAGGLRPHTDDWDRKLGKVESISTAPARMYARLYAGMHMPEGMRIESEAGSRSVWGYYFFLTAGLVAWIEYPYPFQRHIIGYEDKLAKWTRKVSRRPHTLKSVFLQGTDIAGNYPILIGLRNGAVHPMAGSRFFNLHERRSGLPIATSDFTHIEVPKANAEETAALLLAAGYSVPVIPIEEGERYCRTFSFWHLASGKSLRKA